MKNISPKHPRLDIASDSVISEGESLINHIELLLEQSFDSHTTWRDIRTSNSIRKEEDDLRTVFLAHRKYAGNNIDRQLSLTAGMSESYSQLIDARVSVLESQKRTIETLMRTCTDIVYIHRGEVSAMRSNLLAGAAIFTAVAVLLALKV
jgi:hypothetical protein